MLLLSSGHPADIKAVFWPQLCCGFVYSVVSGLQSLHCSRLFLLDVCQHACHTAWGAVAVVVVCDFRWNVYLWTGCQQGRVHGWAEGQGHVLCCIAYPFEEEGNVYVCVSVIMSFFFFLGGGVSVLLIILLLIAEKLHLWAWIHLVHKIICCTDYFPLHFCFLSLWLGKRQQKTGSLWITECDCSEYKTLSLLRSRVNF